MKRKGHFPSHALAADIRTNRYGAYCVPLSGIGRPAVDKVIAREVYEPDTIQFMIDHCSGGDIVHAGAYFGDFIPALSLALAPDAFLWAFEPNQESYCCARITCELNGLNNVRLTNAGLSEIPNTLPLQIRRDDGSALGGMSKFGKEGVATPVMALDSHIPTDRMISVLQLDVEGFEEQALRGAVRLIERCSPILILELQPGSTLAQSEWYKTNIIGRNYYETNRLHQNIVLERAACGL
jgi:FkbM family methyltransferase